MKKDKSIIVKVDENDEKIIDELRNEFNINISAFVRKSLQNEYKRLKMTK